MKKNNANKLKQCGKDLIIKIPKEIEKSFRIRKGTRVKLYPEANKLIIETIKE